MMQFTVGKYIITSYGQDSDAGQLQEDTNDFENTSILAEMMDVLGEDVDND